MQYRNSGKLEWKLSALGFGCMRLATLDGERRSVNIDEDATIRQIRHAIDNGVNYVDTAYPYHGGQSEIVVGKALLNDYREKVNLATKLPVWKVESPEDFDKYLAEQLQKLQTDHIDFYLLHGLNKKRWPGVLKNKLLDKAAAAIADGRIRYIGFSFHDDYQCFEEIINGTDIWDFCQIRYNYMDIELQAGMRGLKLAASKGLAVIVMEPLLGGRLADPPKEVLEAMEAFPIKRSPAEWALQWLWDQPEVTCVLSGMNAMEQVEQNLEFADRSRIGMFGEAEQKLIAQVREMYLARTVIACTKCGYCVPCPNGVDIPTNFEHYNHVYLYDDLAAARFRYQHFTAQQRSSACIACETCADLCPQQVPISEWMKKVTELLA